MGPGCGICTERERERKERIVVRRWVVCNTTSTLLARDADKQEKPAKRRKAVRTCSVHGASYPSPLPRHYLKQQQHQDEAERGTSEHERWSIGQHWRKKDAVQWLSRRAAHGNLVGNLKLCSADAAEMRPSMDGSCCCRERTDAIAERGSVDVRLARRKIFSRQQQQQQTLSSSLQ
jgi:hypothetical protein